MSVAVRKRSRLAVALRLREKITLPYILLTLAVAAVAAFLVTQAMVSRLEARFRGQLFEAARVVNDQFLEAEKAQLALWRQIRFTDGLPAATANRAVEEIAARAAPLAISEGWGFVAVVDDAGAVLWSLGRPAFATDVTDYGPLQSADFATQTATVRALRGTRDQLGDKWMELWQTSGVNLLVTTGPIRAEEQIVGALLVGTHLEELLARASLASLGRVTVYLPSGAALATTLDLPGETTPAVDPDFYTRVLADQETSAHSRELELADLQYSELFGPLEVRGGEDIAVVSVALPRQFVLAMAGQTRNVLIAAFAGSTVAILLIGWWVARSITRPVEHLAVASVRVAGGDLSRPVPVDSSDEIGELARSFNIMLDGLRERERIKDLFGMFATPEVVEELMQHGFELGGHNVEATAMFSDIRGFTTITEARPAAEVIDLLNDYFTYMISAIGSEGGIWMMSQRIR
ncbi:MAG: HAMP domain-containing protein [Anaerolineales bacterium]